MHGFTPSFIMSVPSRPVDLDLSHVAVFRICALSALRFLCFMYIIARHNFLQVRIKLNRRRVVVKLDAMFIPIRALFSRD